MTDDVEIQIRFHQRWRRAPVGPHGEEAEKLAFPDGQFASEIE